MTKPRNDRNQAVTKFCLSMEEHRRTETGRVRTARELVMNFFPYDEGGATDRIFNLIPNEVRGPVLSGWGIRGGKAALKDDDEKVRDVVHDALVAGDIDENTFEQGLTAQILVDWVALPDWWAFWRQGKLTGVAIQRALAVARELELIDDRWFLANVQGRNGRLKGTDVVCDTLSKDQIVAWIRKLHESGDGSPAGLVAALGWETVLAKTAQEALLFALDAFAKKAGLVLEPPPVAEKVEPKDAQATVARQPIHEPRTDAPVAPESGIEVAIPDIPVVDGADEEAAQENTGSWGGPLDENADVAEARAKMMEMLGGPEVPADQPSQLEWPEPPAAEPSKPPPVPKKGSAPTPTR